MNKEQVKGTKIHSDISKRLGKNSFVIEDFLDFLVTEDLGIKKKGFNYANALRVLADIVDNTGVDSCIENYKKYATSNSQKEKTLIRRGKKNIHKD